MRWGRGWVGNGTQGTWGMFTRIPGNFFEDFGESYHFKIPGNIWKDLGKCLGRFLEMLLKILGNAMENVQDNSGECLFSEVGLIFPKSLETAGRSNKMIWYFLSFFFFFFFFEIQIEKKLRKQGSLKMKAKIINKSWHTRKVVTRTLWWDPESRTLGLDYGGTILIGDTFEDFYQ